MTLSVLERVKLAPAKSVPATRSDRRTAWSLTFLLAMLAAPLVGGIVELAARRPYDWALSATLCGLAVLGLLVVAGYVLLVPLDSGGSSRTSRS